MKYRVGDVIRFKSLRNNEETYEGTIEHIEDGENFFIRYPDAIGITSDTDLIDRDQIIDHIPKKAARLRAARLKASGDESFRLMKLAIEEIETWQKEKRKG